MRVLLIGDSHLARIADVAHPIATEVDSRAIGGAVATDLHEQVGALDLSGYDAVVLSVGTNDAAPWKQTSLTAFTDAIAGLVEQARGCPLVFVCSPGVAVEQPGDRTVAALAEYADVAARLIAESGGVVVRTPQLLARLGAEAFISDGLHLSPAAYDVLLPAIGAAVRSVTRTAVPREG